MSANEYLLSHNTAKASDLHCPLPTQYSNNYTQFLVCVSHLWQYCMTSTRNLGYTSFFGLHWYMVMVAQSLGLNSLL